MVGADREGRVLSTFVDAKRVVVQTKIAEAYVFKISGVVYSRIEVTIGKFFGGYINVFGSEKGIVKMKVETARW